jgi:hypothetical protein
VSAASPTATNLTPSLNPQSLVTAFAWSPTAPMIAYTANQDSTNNYQLFIVDMSGASPGAAVKASGAVAATTNVAEFQWSPVGGRIAFEAPVNGHTELYVVDVSGAAVTSKRHPSRTCSSRSHPERLRARRCRPTKRFLRPRTLPSSPGSRSEQREKERSRCAKRASLGPPTSGLPSEAAACVRPTRPIVRTK